MASKKKFSIETIFTMIDRATAPIKSIGRQTKKFSNIVKRSFRAARIAAVKFGRAVKRITFRSLKRISQISFAALAVGVGLAVRAFVSFDQAITSAVAKFGGINLASKEGQKAFDDLKKAARSVGAVTEFTAAQAAEGLNFLAMAGINVKKSIILLPQIVDLATVAQVDLGRAVDIATDTMGAFNLVTDDTIQLQENMARVNDVLAKTISTSNTNMEQLFEAVSAGGIDFKTAGQSIETFSAMVGLMASKSIKGGRAGTILKNIIIRLSKPVGDGAKLIKNLKLETEDSNGNFLDMVTVMESLQKKLSKMGTKQRSAAISTIFGSRAQSGIGALFLNNIKLLRIYRQSLIDSGGTAQKIGNIMRMSILNKLKSLTSALTEASFVLIQEFSEDGIDGIDRLTEAVRKFDMKAVAKTIREDVIPAIDKLLKVIVILGGALGKVGGFFSRVLDRIEKDAEEFTMGILKARFEGIQGPRNLALRVLNKTKKTSEKITGPETTIGVRSPEAIIQKSISETTQKNKLEVSLKDGLKGKLTEDVPGSGITLLPSGVT